MSRDKLCQPYCLSLDVQRLSNILAKQWRYLFSQVVRASCHPHFAPRKELCLYWDTRSQLESSSRLCNIVPALKSAGTRTEGVFCCPQVQPVAELSELSRRSGHDGGEVVLDDSNIRGGTLRRSGSRRFNKSTTVSSGTVVHVTASVFRSPSHSSSTEIDRILRVQRSSTQIVWVWLTTSLPCDNYCQHKIFLFETSMVTHLEHVTDGGHLGKMAPKRCKAVSTNAVLIWPRLVLSKSGRNRSSMIVKWMSPNFSGLWHQLVISNERQYAQALRLLDNGRHVLKSEIAVRTVRVWCTRESYAKMSVLIVS